MNYLRWGFMLLVSILFPLAAWAISGWSVDLGWWMAGATAFSLIVELAIVLTKKK
jgi:hypothetical protein